MGKVVSMKGSGQLGPYTSSDVMLDRWKDEKLENWRKENNSPGMKIFVCSTGRCGTLYMAEIMRE